MEHLLPIELNTTDLVWVNSRPLSPRDFIGKIVLVDFWTYSSFAYLKKLPYLKSWLDKYKEYGLEMISVHRPEFQFEKSVANVKNAVIRLGMDWPVILDNECLFGGEINAGQLLFDYVTEGEGKISYSHQVEHDYVRLERAIRNLIFRGKSDVSLPSISTEHKHGSACIIPSKDIYGGYMKGAFANTYIKPDEIFTYNSPFQLPKDILALNGKFLLKSEYAETIEPRSSVQCNFTGSEINIVMEPVGRDAVVNVSFNGQNLRSNFRGRDLDAGGTVNITEPRMYNLVKSDVPLEGVIEISAMMNNFRVYVFTFSGCVY